MKRTWLLLILFLILGGGAFYALRMKKTQTGSHVSWDMDFAVTDPSKIYKVFLADRTGRTVTLERRDGEWIYNGKYRARPTAVQTLLQTISEVKVYYIPPEAAIPVMVKAIGAEGIKVEVYGKDGDKLKTYYVGGVTNDETGTVMMMENAEQPYITHVPGFVGQLRVRFFMGEDDWRDRALFTEKPEDIQSISIEYPQQKKESFVLERTGEAKYEVKPLFSTTPPNPNPQRKGVPEAYLLQYENLTAEAFETNNPLRDSVTALVPFAVLNVKKKDGKVKQARFWPVAVKKGYYTKENYVVRYFTETEGDFFLTQEQVFGPVFRGYDYFFEGTPKSQLLQ